MNEWIAFRFVSSVRDTVTTEKCQTIPKRDEKIVIVSFPPACNIAENVKTRLTAKAYVFYSAEESMVVW